MSIQGLEIPSQRVGFLGGSGVLVVIGIAFLAFSPTKPLAEGVSVTAVGSLRN